MKMDPSTLVRWWTAIALTALLCIGCSAVPQASGSAVPVPSPSSSAAEASLTPVASGPDASVADSPCLPHPHVVREFEREMPEQIAGRPLEIWSVDGELLVLCFQQGSETDVKNFDAELATEGLTLGDLSMVIAGRSDHEADPPYFIFAYRLSGHRGDEWPATTGLDHPDEAAFGEADVGGKQVLVGELAAVEQSESARGRPYVWNSPTAHYLIVTDDEAWAAEALESIE